MISQPSNAKALLLPANGSGVRLVSYNLKDRDDSDMVDNGLAEFYAPIPELKRGWVMPGLSSTYKTSQLSVNTVYITPYVRPYPSTGLAGEYWILCPVTTTVIVNPIMVRVLIFSLCVAHSCRTSQSQRRPATRTLSFVPYADWNPGQAYDDLPPSCMHYFIEWKLTVNRRIIAKQTENDLVVAPSDFWTEELLSKIADIVKSTGKSCEADATTIAISVNDRSEHDIIKRFAKLDID